MSAETNEKPAGGEPGKTGASAHRRALEAEILSLSESGKDPSRLWTLRREYDDQRLRQIDEALAMMKDRDPETVRKFQETAKASWRPYEIELSRTDLTIPELIFLTTTLTKKLEQRRYSLLAEKQSIEQRRHPGKRR